MLMDLFALFSDDNVLEVLGKFHCLVYVLMKYFSVPGSVCLDSFSFLPVMTWRGTGGLIRYLAPPLIWIGVI